MKIVLISAGLNGLRCLQQLLKQKRQVAAIFTLKDELTANVSGFVAFDEVAEANSIPLFKVGKISSPQAVERLRKLEPDLIFVVGFSQLIPKEVLDIPKKGCIGFHPTLLPKHRGRAPIPWTIIKGLKKSGATMFYLDEGADSGLVIGQEQFDVREDETASTLYSKATDAFVKMIEGKLPLIEKGKEKRDVQDDSKATYWKKRTPADGLLDWKKQARELWTLVRAVTKPYPGAFTYWRGKKLTIWEAGLVEGKASGKLGSIAGISGSGFLVKAKGGMLLAKRVQVEGMPETDAIKFVKENKISIGDMLGVELA